MPILRLGLLLLLTFAVHFKILWGEFVWDDEVFILANPSLHVVKSLGSVFRYNAQPARPVSNFFLALCHFLSTSVFAQRFLSLSLHAAVVVLLYLNLQRLFKRLDWKSPIDLPLWISLLFALHPVTSEALGVAYFRGEILGTLFTLAAMLLAQRLAVQKSIGRYVLLFIFIGLAALSKEVFAVLTPFSVLLIYYLEKKSPRFFITVLGMEAVWACLLFILLRKPVPYPFSYVAHVGWGVYSLGDQIRFAAAAVLEGFAKMFSGSGLTVTPLSTRHGVLDNLNFSTSLLTLLGFLGISTVALFRFKPWVRVFMGMLLVGIGVYLPIPNVNLGSEHYLYFCLIAFCSLLVTGLWRLLSAVTAKPQFSFYACALLYAVFSTVTLESRILDYRSLIAFNQAEAESHPEVAKNWALLIDAHFQKTGKLDSAYPYLEEARRRFPQMRYFTVAQFQYFLAHRRLDLAEALLPELETQATPKERMAALYLDLTLAQIDDGKCDRSKLSFSKAQALNGDSEILRHLFEKRLSAKQQGTHRCTN